MQKKRLLSEMIFSTPTYKSFRAFMLSSTLLLMVFVATVVAFSYRCFNTYTFVGGCPLPVVYLIDVNADVLFSLYCCNSQLLIYICSQLPLFCCMPLLHFCNFAVQGSIQLCCCYFSICIYI